MLDREEYLRAKSQTNLLFFYSLGACAHMQFCLVIGSFFREEWRQADVLFLLKISSGYLIGICIMWIVRLLALKHRFKSNETP